MPLHFRKFISLTRKYTLLVQKDHFSTSFQHTIHLQCIIILHLASFLLDTYLEVPLVKFAIRETAHALVCGGSVPGVVKREIQIQSNFCLQQFTKGIIITPPLPTDVF
jgi:hypothetical protein